MSYRSTNILIIILASLAAFSSFSQNGKASYQVAVLKYKGGGDWYSNPTAIPNLVTFCNKNLGTFISETVETVDVGGKFKELFTRRRFPSHRR